MSNIQLRTELHVILLNLNPVQYRKAICRILIFGGVYHENVVTISCFRTFLIFSQSYIFNYCVAICFKCFFLYLYLYAFDHLHMKDKNWINRDTMAFVVVRLILFNIFSFSYIPAKTLHVLRNKCSVTNISRELILNVTLN